jgi:ubiquitin-protein ligase
MLISSPTSSSAASSSSAAASSSLTSLSTSLISKASLTKDELEELYKRALRDLQYAELDDISGYHYTNSLGTSLANTKGIRRLASEHSDWPSSLPLFLNSSIWIRASSQRMDVVRFLISGPEGTPYSSGLFLFDAFFPSDYPNNPPKVNLMTTGGGSVRFNPNLYNCGKVCLSLLGTWPGDNGWDPKMSTFLQVLISIQSLILIEHPYFNEPGYERSMGTTQGDASTTKYNQNIRLQNITFAMIDMMKNPPKGFEEIVKLHFTLKKDIIIKETRQWANEDPSINHRLNTLLALLAEL